MVELYSKEILRLATEIPYLGRLEEPDTSVQKTSRICGSRIVVDACFEGDRISQFAQEVKACALGQASAALFGEMVLGLDQQALMAARAALIQVLEGEKAPVDYPQFGVFAPAAQHKSRHTSILLPYDATLDAFKNVA